jgi:D-serine deaminase-like pyridoxal phosphate-dependent protein
MSREEVPNFMTPMLLVDYERLENNIKKMAEKARDNGVNLRPHIKTHKCVEIGEMQLKHGANGITVSTLDEAAIFANAGFDDILYAVPITSNKVEMAVDLASKNKLKLLIDSHQNLSQLNEAAKKRDISLEILLKVHCGYQRTGANPRHPAATRLAARINDSKNLDFKGILTHAGHSYDATSIEQIKEIANHEQSEMIKFAERLASENQELNPEVVSIGSTPTIALVDEIMEGITEVRPGNYVFYDYYQVALGSCRTSDCALTVIGKIIGRYDDYFVTDTGATSLSKDLGPAHLKEASYGKIYADYYKHKLDSSLHLYSLSQEHGKVKFKDNSDGGKYQVNDEVRILPNHSCLTANLHDCYYVVKEGKTVDKWRVRRNRPFTSVC